MQPEHRKFRIFATAVLLSLTLVTGAAAGQDAVNVIPDAGRFRAATAELPAAITGNYTIVPNVTAGFAGNISYIRFPNANPTKATVASVRIIGNATGRDYGTAIVNSPARSSPQVSVPDLLALANSGALDPTDTRITLYVQSGDFLTGIQHVYFNSTTGFFENMSVCSFEDGLSYVPTTSLLANVHTSTLSGFPSTVEVHNKKATATTVRLRVHDARTGSLLGIFQFTASANTSYTFTNAQIETAINYKPGPTDFHMNVIFDGDPGTPTGVILSHSVRNLLLQGATLNLTTICSIDY